MRGQWQLHQDAVDGGVVVQPFNPGQQVGLAHAGVVLFEHRVQASVFTGLNLVAHIDLAGRVFAHQHHRQTGRDAFGLEGQRARSDLGAQLFGQGVAVDELSGHGGCLNGGVRGKKQNARHRLGRF